MYSTVSIMEHNTQHFPPKYQYCLPLAINLIVFVMILTTHIGQLEAIMIATGCTLGSLALISTLHWRTSRQLLELLDTHAQQLATRERARIAIDLHDSVTQLIAATSLWADSIPPEAASPDTNYKLDRLRAMTATTHAAIRHLLLGLHPADICRIPLHQLARELIDYKQPITPITIELHHYSAGIIAYPPDVHYALYRIIDLALSNAIQHSCASSIRVFLRLNPDQAIVIIEDDGIGFDFATVKLGHYGLTDISIHARHIGASLSCEDTKPGPQPKRIVCTWRRPHATH